MPLPTREVVCVMHDQEGAPVPGATFDAVLNQFEVYQGYVVPQRVIGTADEQGVCVLNLWPNQLGSVESAYVVRMRSPAGKSLTITAVVPNQPTANLHDVAVLPPFPGKIDGQVQVEAAIEAGQQAQVFAQAAEASATAAAQSESNAAASEANASSSEAAAASSEALAQEWATKTDAEVVVGEGYGAKKYAIDAAASEAVAAAKASEAAASESNAAISASTAAAQAGVATSAASAASGSASDAAASAATATAQAGISTIKAGEAAASEANAAASASTASAQSSTATIQAGIATTKAGEAAASAVAAAAAAAAAETFDPENYVPLAGGVTMAGTLSVPALNDGHLAGHRNRIINGDMRIAQRGTSFAAALGYTLDRWLYFSFGASVATVSRQADAPTGSGFVDSLRVTVTTGDNSLAAGDFALLSTAIEGKYVTDLIGKPFTLSFWVRSSRAGTYCVAFSNAGEDRTYVATYSITAANTWQKKTITISGGLITDGTWDWGNGSGVTVTFPLASGSSFHTTPGDWRTGNYLSTSAQQNAINAASNIFAITGVQLEPGTVATPFERRINELELCQRYARLNSVTTGWSTSTTAVVVPAYFDKPMRDVPSATLTNGVDALFEPGVSLRDITSIASASLTASGGFLEFTTPALTTEKPHLLLPDRVLFSAEL